MKKLIIRFVCGEICSGKSTIAKEMAATQNLYFIEVSDIVKGLLKSASREQLQKSGYLESQIVLEISIILSDIRAEGKYDGFVISGVRQRGIINCLESLQSMYTFFYHWIDIDEETRFERYMKRGDLAKDKLTRDGFEEAQNRDNELGIQEVKKYIKNY